MARDLLFPGSIVSLHRKAVDKLLTSGDGDAALLYLCLAAEKDGASLKWEANRLESAQRTLLNLHLLAPETPVTAPPPQKLEPDAPPDYTTADISLAIQGTGGFAGLVPEVERLLGKPLSPADLKTLYLLFDFLSLPPEVILTLVGWCVERTAEKYGAGRKPTMNQIKKEGFRWQKAGVDTLDAADAHVRRLTEMNTRVVQIMALIGIRGRKPVGSEQKYLDAWAQMGFSDDAIQLAYEKTLFNVQKFNWSYMNGILASWHRQGLTTAAAVAEAEGPRKPNFSRPVHPNQGQGMGQAPLPSDDIGRMMEEARRAREQQEGREG